MQEKAMIGQAEGNLKVFVGTLLRLFHPSAVESALTSAAKDAGIENIDAYISNSLPMTLTAASEKTSGGSPNQDVKEKKARKPRGVVSYNIFITKALDKISKEPSYMKLAERAGADREPPMSVAISLWKALHSDVREAFVKAYQPLCDQLKVEMVASGHKTDKLLQRITDFECNASGATMTLARQALPDIHIPRGGGITAAVVAANGANGSSSPSSSDSKEGTQPSVTSSGSFSSALSSPPTSSSPLSSTTEENEKGEEDEEAGHDKTTSNKAAAKQTAASQEVAAKKKGRKRAGEADKPVGKKGCPSS